VGKAEKGGERRSKAEKGGERGGGEKAEEGGSTVRPTVCSTVIMHCNYAQRQIKMSGDGVPS
jgi:hypothetical protein